MSDHPSDRPSDEALWAGVGATLRDVVLPRLDDGWARTQTIMLIALAEQARTRGADPAPRMRADVATALDSLAGNPLVAAHWPADPAGWADPSTAAAGALVAAVGRDDAAAEDVCRVLRPLLVAQLDELLATNATLMDAFRGKLPS